MISGTTVGYLVTGFILIMAGFILASVIEHRHLPPRNK